VEAAKVTMVFNFVNPFMDRAKPYWSGAMAIHTYLQTLTRPRTSMVLGFRNFNINEPAVVMEQSPHHAVVEGDHSTRV